MLTVYICHPYSGDPKGNTEKVRRICELAAREGVLPIAPHLFLPQFVSEETDRNLAMRMCIQLVAKCDEVWVFGDVMTEGMKAEIEAASESVAIVFKTLEEMEGP
jgi:dienelactone hydrolase